VNGDVNWFGGRESERGFSSRLKGGTERGALPRRYQFPIPPGVRPLRTRTDSDSEFNYGVRKKSERRDLNPRPPRPKRGALPGCATFRREIKNQSEKIKIVKIAGYSPIFQPSQYNKLQRTRQTQGEDIADSPLTQPDLGVLLFSLFPDFKVKGRSAERFTALSDDISFSDSLPL
jgi:hypothetical protein